MPHVDREVGRMLINLEQRLQPIQDQIRSGLAAGLTYDQLRVPMAQAAKLKKMVAELEGALCGPG